MIDIAELNSFPTQDGGSLALLKEIAQKYCPEELQAERKAILPDEQLNLSELEAGASGWRQRLRRTSLPRRYRCSDEDHSS